MRYDETSEEGEMPFLLSGERRQEGHRCRNLFFLEGPCLQEAQSSGESGNASSL
jgi:hypothetical protein